jgi:hypothetical protein
VESGHRAQRKTDICVFIRGLGVKMITERRPANDPRTLARDIPGLLDALFPQLTPGVVAHFNRKATSVANCAPVPQVLVAASNLQRSMLFEIAVAAAEQLLQGYEVIDWAICLDIAVERQRRHFDAELPGAMSEVDKTVATLVARNLVVMLRELLFGTGDSLVRSPTIPGYQWVASGLGDFSIGTRLIEVKCTNKHFASADYRQIIMYWLLGYAYSLERGTSEWTEAVLVNPRRNFLVRLPIDEIVSVLGAGRSKVELLELFSTMIGDRSFHMSQGI